MSSEDVGADSFDSPRRASAAMLPSVGDESVDPSCADAERDVVVPPPPAVVLQPVVFHGAPPSGSFESKSSAKPVSQVPDAVTPRTVTSSKAEVFCKRWFQGRCFDGERCRYSHNFDSMPESVKRWKESDNKAFNAWLNSQAKNKPWKPPGHIGLSTGEVVCVGRSDVEDLDWMKTLDNPLIYNVSDSRSIKCDKICEQLGFERPVHWHYSY